MQPEPEPWPGAAIMEEEEEESIGYCRGTQGARMMVGVRVLPPNCNPVHPPCDHPMAPKISWYTAWGSTMVAVSSPRVAGTLIRRHVAPRLPVRFSPPWRR